MRCFPVLFLLTAVGLTRLAGAAEPQELTHQDLRDEALAAAEAKDFGAARAAAAAALKLRPDSPRYLHLVAAYTARTGDTKGALSFLRELVALGVAPAIERDPAFTALQGTPEFFELRRQLAANRAPQGEVDVFAELPGRTGIIEGIAYDDRAQNLFLGDVHHRCIWRRDRTGQVTQFTADDDELLGIFGLAIDSERNALWAAMTAVPEMNGYTREMKGHSAVAEFNLTTGELRRVVPIPGDGRDHGVGDLTVARDGTLYLPDSKAPVIWKFAVGAEEIEKAAESPAFSSLQGIIVDRRLLVVADYDNGLFRVDLSNGAVTALTPPAHTTLVGLDGLLAIPGGLIAVQNGVAPQRVLRVNLSPDFDKITSVAVLASGVPQLEDLTLVALVQGRPAVIAGSGWDLPGSTVSKQPPAHPVRIFQVALP